MFKGGQNVTQTACTGQRETKKSFKGVENFLRRVAYNLGNSPSQTEVKIISCIPIDVTDLQDRIILLEKELEAAKKQYPPHNTKEITLPTATSVVNANYNNQFKSESAPNTQLDDIKETSFDFQKPTTVGYITPKKRTYAMTNTEYTGDFPEYSKNSYFSKKKRQIKKKLQNCHKTNFVFHAQTEGGPFQGNHNSASRSPNGKGNTQECVKQYESPPMFKTNKFSSPILKDARAQNCSYDSDLCSCCRGKFQNIDDHMSKPYCSLFDPLLTIAREDYVNNRGNYYDSTLYDIVPVKEKTIKSKKEISSTKRNEFQELIDMLCNPQQMRPKSAPRQRQYVVNYQTVTPNRYANRHQSDRKVLPKRRLGPNYLEKQNSSKYCYVSCGNVYAKKPPQKLYKYSTINSLPRKKVNCFTSMLNLAKRSKNTECQTIIEKSTSEHEPKSPKEKENKTEETLNQIKTILQTVLQEVKTNSECGKNVIKNKKDAVVQKDTSQSKVLEGSALLNSFSYTPYTPIPSANFPPQPPPSYFYPHNLQDPRLTCQNYPVFVPGAGHHMCNTQCKQPHEMENKHTRSKTSNKLMQQKRSTETNKLIKEIYKSLALSMDNTALLEKRNDSFDKPPIANVPKAKEVKTEPVKVRSYVTNMAVNTRSVPKNTITNLGETADAPPLKKNKGQEKSAKINKLTASKSTDQSTSTETLTMAPSAVQRSGDDDEDSETSSDTEGSVATTMQTSTTKSHQTKKEAGIFRRVFNMFKKSKTNTSKAEQTESDSESDYQTIYKEPVTRPNPTIHFSYPPKHIRKSRNHSKIFSSRSRIGQQVKKKDKRNPRHHDRYHYNEHQYGNYQSGRRPVYHQTFDARNAVCDYNYYPKNVTMEVPKTKTGPTTTEKVAKTGLKWLKSQKQELDKCQDEWRSFMARI